MHELGLLAEIVDKIEGVAKENKIKEIATLVLQVGEFSGIVPQYLSECYPAVIEGTMLENAKLDIEVIKGRGVCHDCKAEFDLVENMQACPVCGSNRCEITQGADFVIKEIVVK